MIPGEEVAERECEACSFEWELWNEVSERTGGVEWGRIALEMMDLDEYIEVFRVHPSEVSAIEWDFLKAVRGERARRRAYHEWRASQVSTDGHGGVKDGGNG